MDAASRLTNVAAASCGSLHGPHSKPLVPLFRLPNSPTPCFSSPASLPQESSLFKLPQCPAPEWRDLYLTASHCTLAPPLLIPEYPSRACILSCLGDHPPPPSPVLHRAPFGILHCLLHLPCPGNSLIFLTPVSISLTSRVAILRCSHLVSMRAIAPARSQSNGTSSFLPTAIAPRHNAKLLLHEIRY